VASISRLLKLQVSFAEYRLFYRALLQKRPIILRSLLVIATPYEVCGCTYLSKVRRKCGGARYLAYSVPISFVGGPWRATGDSVCGRVISMLYQYGHHDSTKARQKGRKEPVPA